MLSGLSAARARSPLRAAFTRWAANPVLGPASVSSTPLSSRAPKSDNAFMRPVILVSGGVRIGDAWAEGYRVTSHTGRFCQTAL